MMTGVALGAMGAHALEGLLSADQIDSFETGVRYQLIHGLALLILPLLGHKNGHKWQSLSSLFMVAGVIFFSGSIYLLSCKSLWPDINFINNIWPLTPIGGLCLILAWILNFFSLLKNR